MSVSLRRIVLLLMLLIATSLGSSACSLARPLRIDASVPAIPRPDLTPPVPNPEPFAPLPVTFVDDEQGRLCLDQSQYQNLARNLADMSRWADEARARLDYYRGEQ